MKKKLIAALLAIVCAVCLAFGLAACDLFGGNSNVTKVTLDRDELTLKVNDKDYLTATVSPSNADDKTVAWAASPSGIVTVVGYEEYCLILGVKEGNAIVTATVGGKKASCRVTVTAADDNPGIDDPDKQIPLESIVLNKTAATLEIDDTETLTATVAPDNATDKTVTWESDKPEIASVDNNGTVTAKSAGTAVIIATCGGKTASCTVKVNAPAPSEFTNKTYVFDKFECESMTDEEIEEMLPFLKNHYIVFGTAHSVKVYGLFVCGDNAKFEQVGNEIRIYTYPDTYPDFYRSFTYDNNELIFELEINDGDMRLQARYVFVLQTAE